MISVHPARWCTSPLGVVPAGLGDGVRHCHDVAKFPRVCLFISLLYLFWGNKFPKVCLFNSLVFSFGGIKFTLFSRVWVFLYRWIC